MLLDKEDGGQVHIPEELVFIDRMNDWRSSRDLQRGFAGLIILGAFVYWLSRTV